MKRYLFLITIGAAALFTACDESLLDIPQKGVIAMDQFYNTDEDAESAAVTMYADFIQNIGGVDSIYNPYMVAFNLPGDDALAAGNFYGDNDHIGEIDEFRYDSQSRVLKNMYQRLYWVNHKCNLITDNFAEGESKIKDRVIAEARTIRAWLHMMAAIGWYNPPKIDHVLEGTDKPTNCDHVELLTWCAEEAEWAAKSGYMDVRKDVNDKNGSVKATEGLAWTVAGKAYLFLGNYEKAKECLKKVIDSGKYALVPGERWSDLFHMKGDGNEEKIFEGNVVYNAQVSINGKTTGQHTSLWTWRCDRFPVIPNNCAVSGWGGLSIDEKYAEAMLAHDGDSWRRKGTFMTEEEFLYTSGIWPSDATLTTMEAKKTDKMRGISDPRGMYGQSKYLHHKRMVNPDEAVKGWSTTSQTNFLIFRYAEVLLMYAEACAMTSDADGSGLKALQDIQKRAGIPEANISKTLTLDAVKKEKRFEMWLEGVNWPDMKRWGDYSALANVGDHIPTLYDEFFMEGKPGYQKEHKLYVEYSDPNADKTHGFKAGRHEYYPFPYDVFIINPNLVQKEGF